MKDKITARNYFTGKELRTPPPNDNYRAGYDAIWGKDKKAEKSPSGAVSDDTDLVAIRSDT